MPANKNARQRYLIIDRLLTRQPNQYPSLAEIADACSRQLRKEVSTSCIEKDLRRLIHGDEEPMYPKAPIVYSPKNKGYYYAQQGFSLFQANLTEAEWESLRYAALLLFQYKEIPVFGNFKSAIERLSKSLELGLEPDESFDKRFVQFEAPVSDGGLAWLTPLYRVIKKEGSVELEYENIYKNTRKTYQLVPYLLKENRNRWYVIGWVAERADYLTFALDRIQSLTIDETRQPRRSDFNVDLFLRHSIGITEQNAKPVTVRLQIKPPYDRLLQLEPLHPSQQIRRQTKNGMEISIETYLSPELYHRLLSFGPYCKVLSPRKLISALEELVQKTMDQYRPVSRS